MNIATLISEALIKTAILPSPSASVIGRPYGRAWSWARSIRSWATGIEAKSLSEPIIIPYRVRHKTPLDAWTEWSEEYMANMNHCVKCSEIQDTLVRKFETAASSRISKYSKTCPTCGKSWQIDHSNPTNPQQMADPRHMKPRRRQSFVNDPRMKRPR